MILNGQTVGGLTLYCVDAITTLIQYCSVSHSFIYKLKPQWMILNGPIVGGLTLFCVDAITT